VRDLEATMRRYVDDYGIGPWEVCEFDAGKAEDFREYGQPVERSWAPCSRRRRPGAVGADRTARRGERLRAFSRREGEGVHHVAVATPDFDETVAQATRGNGVILSLMAAGKPAYGATWMRLRGSAGPTDEFSAPSSRNPSTPLYREGA
jgi:methylmalonyl-CoA/ethylmalonyl-CoA epimerase